MTNKQEAKKLEEAVLKKLSLLQKNDTVIVGVSGGADSVFLLHMLKQTPAILIIAHLDHQLRKESAKDAEFVKEISEGNLFALRQRDIQKISKKSKRGVEECGRQERYKFFRALAKKHSAKYIITAHHADDNLETILHNFSRGASLEGLSGMQEIELDLFRPLLSFSKKQITEYLCLRGINYREDESNNDKNYSRNFIRHEIIPKLKKLNPSLEETVARNSKNLRELNVMLEEKAQNWIKKNATKSTKIPLKNFYKQKEVLKQYILRQLHKELIGNCQNVESIHVEEVLTLIERNIGKKKKKLGKLIASIEKQHLLLKKQSR